MDPSSAQAIVQAQADGVNVSAKHDGAQRMYQSSRIQQQTSDTIDDFLANTPSPRPATAGTADSVAAKERAKILKIQAMHLYVIQVALLTILFCLLALWLLPEWAAHMVIILILATGIAAAIYLSQIQ